MGMRGMQCMNGETHPVATDEDRRADRRRALRLWLLIAVLTVVGTGLTIVFPYP